jgi:hypothetical protein
VFTAGGSHCALLSIEFFPAVFVAPPLQDQVARHAEQERPQRPAARIESVRPAQQQKKTSCATSSAAAAELIMRHAKL